MASSGNECSEWPAQWPGLTVQQCLEVEPERAAIATVIEWAEQAGAARGWPPRAVFALTLCVDEALTNILSHARPPEGGQLSIRLMLGQADWGHVLGISDNGGEFDPTAQASAALAATLDEAEIGGHGLRLMRHYLHVFEYRRVDGRNLLLLGVRRENTP